ITDEVDRIIDTELKSLEEKFARSGVPGVTDEINLRIESWGRIGAVYMVADANFERIAGNVTHWPFDGMPAERWPEFEIATIEPGRRAVHPVRAAVPRVPGGDLAACVNRVLDRLEGQAVTLRATFDRTAHDLRAPLHRLRTRMDALLLRSPPPEPAVRESIESALREVDHLQRTLATLLQIALAESGAPLASAASVDVAGLAAELVELFEPLAAAQGLA